VKCAFEHAFPENIIASVLRHGAKRQKQKQKTKTKKKSQKHVLRTLIQQTIPHKLSSLFSVCPFWKTCT